MNQGWGSITQTSTAAQEFCVARRDDNRISSHVPDTLLHHSHRSRDIPFLLWIFCPNRPKTQKSCSYSPVYRSTFSPFINFQGYYTLVVINAPILRSLEESLKRRKSRCGYPKLSDAQLAELKAARKQLEKELDSSTLQLLWLRGIARLLRWSDYLLGSGTTLRRFSFKSRKIFGQ